MVSFVIRLEKIQKDGKWRLVARYDTCHGWPHLDVVNGKGELVLKRWMEGMDTGEAFRWAVLDFEENHEKYN
jgi:SH3-like domain-containing protein